MKCPNCGAPLKMEDKFCTYCGAPNTLAMKHQADMEHYQKEFAETQEEVIKTSRRAGSLTGFLAALIVLIVLNIAGAIMCSRTWDIKNSRRRAYAESHIDDYREAIQKMIDEQDYLALRPFYSSNRLSGTDALTEYEAIVHYAGNLNELFRCLCSTDMYSSPLSKDRIDRTATYLSEDIIALYDDPRASYYDEEAVTDEKLSVIADIRKQAEAMLMTYANFTQEEADDLKNMSKTRIKELLVTNLTEISEEVRETLADDSAAAGAASNAEGADGSAADKSTDSQSVEAFLEEIIGGENI